MPGMKRVGAFLFLASCAAGCARVEPPNAAQGMAHLEEIRLAIEAAASAVRPSLVYVETTIAMQQPGGPGQPGGRRPGGGQMPGGPPVQTVGMTGILLSEDVVLLPIPVPDTAERIQVWHGENAYDATVLRVDPRTQFTLVRAELPAPVTPLASLPARDARPGEWVAVVAAFGKDADFQKMTDLGIVRGRVKGEFDTLVVGAGLPGSLGQQIGAVVLGLDGQLLGIHKPVGMRGAVVAFADCRDRIQKMAANAETPHDAGRPRRERRQPWLGAYLLPVNEQLAEAKGLPKSSLTVRAVFDGGPAERAGLATGDLVTAVDGKAFDATGAQLSGAFLKALAPEPGKSVRLRLLRDGQGLEKTLVIGEVPEVHTMKVDSLGFGVSEITDEMFYDPRRRLSRKDGVIVTEIVRGTPAAVSEQFGRPLLMPNDVITELHHHPVRTFADFTKAVSAIRQEDPPVVLVKLTRGIVNAYAALDLGLAGVSGEDR